MKTLAKITMIVLMSTGSWLLPQKATAQFPGITFQVFYDQLSPYGAWVNDPNYGYVWIPDESAGFYPYGTNGHWVLTEYGWTWVSDYPWGWAPFHYGRWNYDPYYGWIWVPGNEWGPAWVTWRRCNDYYGWAPLGFGITIQMSFTTNFYLPDDRWMFVRDRDFDRADLDKYYVGRRENHDLIRNARAIKNTRIDNGRKVTYVTGPDAREVRTITGRNIKPLPVNENSQPGRTIIGKDQVQIYRPPVSREDVRGQKPAPGAIATRENIKPVSERTKGDLTRTNSNTNLRKGKEQTPPVKNSVPPKYERTDKINQNNNNGVNQGGTRSSGQTKEAGTANGQKSQLPPQRVNPPSENRNLGQSNQKRNEQPPVETRNRELSNQKQMGAPTQKTQPVQPSSKTTQSKGKVTETKKSTGSAPAKTNKNETPVRRGN